MKTKKALLAVGLGIILVILVVGITGLAIAAPKPLDNHEAVPVSGEVTNGGVWGVDFWLNLDNPYPDGDNWVYPGNWVIYQLSGSLQGTYRVDTTITFVSDTPHYFIEGQATFDGQIMGRRTSWVASLQGEGDMADVPFFAGHQIWASTITSSGSPLSHMRGTIVFDDTYGYPEAGMNLSTYSGTLSWEPGKKK
jgi:hypothetical protein